VAAQPSQKSVPYQSLGAKMLHFTNVRVRVWFQGVIAQGGGGWTVPYSTRSWIALCL
jgi:hypothetical protein